MPSATDNMLRSDRLWLVVCCWVGWALRLQSLFANRFHADEALFASWARMIAVWRDPLLLTQAVDKPPLLFYLQALFYPLFGPVEWSARMPSFIASLLLIPLVAQLARCLTADRRGALIAAAIVAIAPLAVQFSATAFTDPLLTFWLIAALYIIAQSGRRRSRQGIGSFLAGIFVGLAMATKYQALLFAPLLLGFAFLTGWHRRDWFRGAMGLAVVLVILFLWQSARPVDGGHLALQWANIGGLRPARSWELWPRILQTLLLWRLALGWPILASGAVLATGLLLLQGARADLTPAESLIALFVIGYSVLHLVWAVPVWDRYLLPILPLVAILLGRGISRVWSAAGRRPPFLGAFAVILFLIAAFHVPIAAAARDGRFPIGGQPTADGGAAEVAQLLVDAPYGTVLYDHWYSWHWRYQLFDGRVYVSWFPHSDALLADLAAFSGSGPARYIALPASEIGWPIIRRLVESGYRLEIVGDPEKTADMTLYRIVGGLGDK